MTNTGRPVRQAAAMALHKDVNRECLQHRDSVRHPCYCCSDGHCSVLNHVNSERPTPFRRLLLKAKLVLRAREGTKHLAQAAAAAHPRAASPRPQPARAGRTRRAPARAPARSPRLDWRTSPDARFPQVLLRTHPACGTQERLISCTAKPPILTTHAHVCDAQHLLRNGHDLTAPARPFTSARSLHAR